MSIYRASTQRARLDPHDIVGIEHFALDLLQSLRQPSGLYCFDLEWGSSRLRGESARYTMMVALGLTRWRALGGESRIDPRELVELVALERNTLNAGDLGLLLLCLCRLGDLDSVLTSDVISLLTDRSSKGDDLAKAPGMEIAWLVWGTAIACGRGLPVAPLFERGWREMQSRASASSPLYRHYGAGRGRALFPNFATEIYTLLALTEVARHGLAPEAESKARALADRLIELRRPDGAWPWIYHADRGLVVEPYELYSVHQDAMAPMALFVLAEVTGDQSYAIAAVEGFHWCFGQNELRFNFYDTITTFAHRSIKRRGTARYTNLWGNTALAAVGPRRQVDLGDRTINTTCRPYHLGWILEAWSGREHLHSLVSGGGQ